MCQRVGAQLANLPGTDKHKGVIEEQEEEKEGMFPGGRGNRSPLPPLFRKKEVVGYLKEAPLLASQLIGSELY